MNSTVIQSIGWLCYRKMTLNHALQASKCKQLSAHNFVRFRRLQVSSRCCAIAISISAIQSHMPDVDTEEMSNSRHSPSLISISVGADHPCCQKPLRSLRSFSLTGTILLMIPSHLACI